MCMHRGLGGHSEDAGIRLSWEAIIGVRVEQRRNLTKAVLESLLLLCTEQRDNWTRDLICSKAKEVYIAIANFTITVVFTCCSTVPVE